MTEPVRTANGDLVERVALFAAEDPAQPLKGGDVPGRPIRTADGALVKRVAAYEVGTGGVAVPVTQLGGGGSTGVAWGDIQGTLANQADLKAQLDAKADSADVPAPADPATQVGLTPIGGSAPTFLRSDGAPALDQGISPAWTGDHDFTGGTIAVPTPTTDAQAAPKGYVDGEVSTASGAAAWGGITGTLSAQTDLNGALAAKADQSALAAHTGDTSNPHAVTKAQVGLGNVDNTSDANKPISAATQAALDTKADESDLTTHEGQQGVTGVHLPAGGTSGQVPTRGTGSTVAWTDPPSAPVQSVNGDTGAVVLAASDVGAIPASELGQANGVATLDGSGKVPAAQLNVSGGFSYLGSWDASSNTPALADGAGNNGDMYKVSVAGSQDLGSGSVAYEVGDHVVYVAGTLNRWERFVASEAVASVAGKTGVVTLVKADVGLDQVDNTSDADKPISTATQTALNAKADTTTVNSELAAKANQTDLTAHEGDTGAGAHLPAGGTTGQLPTKGTGDSVVWADPPSAPVTSVAGKTGVVTLAKADVGLGDVDNTADTAKPVSTAQQTALDGKLDTTGGTVTGSLAVNNGITSGVNVDAQQDVNAGRFVNAAFAFSTTTDGTTVPNPAVNGVNIYGRDDGGQRLVAQWQDGTTNVIAQQGGGANAPAWGQITGTLSAQTDLNTALGAKADQSALTGHEADVGAGAHLPAGGTTGQVPVKGAGDAVAWQDPPAGGGGAPAGANGQLQYNNNGAFGATPSVEILDPALLGGAGLILNGAGGYPAALMSTDGGQTGWLVDAPLGDFAVERVSGGNPTNNFAIHATDAGDHAGTLALNADTVTVNGADIRSASALFTTGQVPQARLAIGNPTADTFLRGDGAWAEPNLGAPEAPVLHSSGDFDLGPSDPPVHLVNATSGQVLASLNAGQPAGTTFTIKKVDASANHLIIGGDGTNVEGIASLSLTQQYSFRTVISDGTDWWVIAQGGT